MASSLLEFLALLRPVLATEAFDLRLGKPRGTAGDLRTVAVRPVRTQSGGAVSLLYRYDRRDEARTLSPVAALAEIERLLGHDLHSAHLESPVLRAQLEFNKKGEPRLSVKRGQPTAGGSVSSETVSSTDPVSSLSHDRAKVRVLDAAESAPWLRALGVVNERGTVREGMSGKFRQIHRFAEVLEHFSRPLLESDASAEEKPLRLVDMGCGKGYLTFAAHDFFNRVAGRRTQVLGVEARPELVELCNRIARETGRAETLTFATGEIASFEFPTLDLLVALHACDTATDDALYQGIRRGARVLLVAPCCQKELRPQLVPPPSLAAPLAHGIFRERQAEFVTDALRALLLEAEGYETKVFEFVSSEHTHKNVLIAATRRPAGSAAQAAAARAKQAVAELKAFYGLRWQRLETLLAGESASDSPPVTPSAGDFTAR